MRREEIISRLMAIQRIHHLFFTEHDLRILDCVEIDDYDYEFITITTPLPPNIRLAIETILV